MNTKLLIATGAAMLLGACDVKDPIYETSHPNHGRIVLTTDWSQRGEGIAVPESHHMMLGDFTATYTEHTNDIDHLFDPATHHLLIHHPAEKITIDGTVARVAPLNERGGVRSLASTRDVEEEYGGLIENNPDWLFTCAMDVEIEKDLVHEITAPMTQQVRQLTLVVELAGGTTDKVERVLGILSGVAGTLDYNTGEHGLPCDVSLDFEKNADGKWSATVRLLGMANIEQRLLVEVYFEDGSPQYLWIESDLTSELADFNTNKKIPLVLGSQAVETPTEAGFTTIITDWNVIDGGSVIAD